MASSLTPKTFDDLLKLLTALGAILSFVWGVYVWRDNKEQERKQAIELQEKERLQSEAENQKQAENRRVEAAKPFLEKQLAFYIEATRVVSQVATNYDPRHPDRIKTTSYYKRFLELYHGELALVENQEVAGAMVAFNRALQHAPADQNDLLQLSLALTRQCRDSLDKSWNIRAWSNPDSANASQPSR